MRRVEYHWLEGHYDRLPALMAELVRRRVAVIATPADAGQAQWEASSPTLSMGVRACPSAAHGFPLQ